MLQILPITFSSGGNRLVGTSMRWKYLSELYDRFLFPRLASSFVQSIIRLIAGRAPSATSVICMRNETTVAPLLSVYQLSLSCGTTPARYPRSPFVPWQRTSTGLCFDIYGSLYITRELRSYHCRYIYGIKCTLSSIYSRSIQTFRA